MSLTSKTKEELMDIIEGQLNDIRMLEAEIDGMWSLLDDIKESEQIINSELNRWEKEGFKPILTQGMYDALISMAYNMGPKVVNKQFMDAVKHGNFENAKNLILKTSSSLFDDYPGLKTRREKEAKMFA